MSLATTISVSVAPELLLRAQQAAEREHLTVDELLSEAIRVYLAGRYSDRVDRWNALRERFQGVAGELGISDEQDIERLSDEYRASQSR